MLTNISEQFVPAVSLFKLISTQICFFVVVVPLLLVSQGFPAHATSAGLLSNQILAVKVSPLPVLHLVLPS